MPIQKIGHSAVYGEVASQIVTGGEVYSRIARGFNRDIEKSRLPSTQEPTARTVALRDNRSVACQVVTRSPLCFGRRSSS